MSPGIDTRRDSEELQAHARAMGVDIARVHVRHDDDVVDVDVDGVLAEALVDDALLCCATHGHGPGTELLLQSTSGDITRRSPRPMVLVGAGGSLRVVPRRSCVTPARAAG